MTDFGGSRVLVTGAGRGIGLAIAERFSAVGAEVTLADLDLESAERAAGRLPNATAIRLDVTDAEAVLKHFDDAVEGYDVVVANAGIPGQEATVLDIDAVQWRSVLDVNLNGVFHTLQGGARRMVREGIHGNIVVTASIAGLTAEANHAVYSTSKWAVIGLLKSAAIELAPHGVRVNGVCPGDVRTELFAEMMDEDVYHGPLGRPAETEEIAEAYIWLASPSARFVSGETLVVDGGLINTTLVH